MTQFAVFSRKRAIREGNMVKKQYYNYLHLIYKHSKNHPFNFQAELNYITDGPLAGQWQLFYQ